MSTISPKKARPSATDPSRQGGGALPDLEKRVAVRARNVHFDTSNTPLHWIPGEPVASHAVSIWNYMLPVGERWFCAVFERILPFVNDEALRQEILGFIGQEAMHSQAHDEVLHTFFAAHGINHPERFADLAEWAERKLYPLLDRLSGNTLLAVLKPQIYFIAVVEHLTAFFGDWMLNSDLEERGADPVMLDLFRWHGAEEVEHRFVAYDVAQYCGVKRWQHVGLTIFVGLFYMPICAFLTRYLVQSDRSLPKMGYLRVLREIRAAGKRGVVPDWLSVLKEIPIVISKDYSPEQAADTAQAVAYLAQSPAARAFQA